MRPWTRRWIAPVVLHFLTAHGLDLALGVASSALWDGIKEIAAHITGNGQSEPGPIKVIAKYQDGPEIRVELTDPAQLGTALQELKKHRSAGGGS